MSSCVYGWNDSKKWLLIVIDSKVSIVYDFFRAHGYRRGVKERRKTSSVFGSVEAKYSGLPRPNIIQCAWMTDSICPIWRMMELLRILLEKAINMITIAVLWQLACYFSSWRQSGIACQAWNKSFCRAYLGYLALCWWCHSWLSWTNPNSGTEQRLDIA